MAVAVVRPGILTTVQDDGRWGYQRFGVPVAGAMDRASQRLANLLVGNRRSAATLEVTWVGPTLEFGQDLLFAVGGACFELSLDGEWISMNATMRARAGQRLTFGRRLSGVRAYVAVAGGFDLPVVLGSRATHFGSRMGGLAGRALKTGDCLPVGQDTARPAREGDTRLPAVQLPIQGARVRVIPGPHDRLFDQNMLEVFATCRYVVTPQSDRMGYRLDGSPITPRGGRELISTATLVGSVQVPPSGRPIVLMADRQTAGGYPQIATVITADLPVVGQLAPGDWMEFEPCTYARAVSLLIAQERALIS